MDASALLTTAQMSAAAPKPAAGNKHDIASAAKEFEAVFIGQMFEQMWSGIKTDGPMGGGPMEAAAFDPASGEVFHGGGLNACGCHFNRQTGECHCHQARGCGCACQSAACG